jgi:hypothetical protein
MSPIRNILLFGFAILLSSGCSAPESMDTAADFVVDGQTQRFGNVPFSRLVLTTDNRNTYVLIFDQGVDEPEADLGRYTVTGRLYSGEWNGERRAHVSVKSAVKR